MKFMSILTPVALMAAISGCATFPAGPSINVLPSQGKSFAVFQTEDATCRTWAEQQLGMPTQQAYENNVATGAIAGAAIGTGLGAAVGSASGHTGGGALIGAVSGLLVGSAVGSDSGRVSGREAQRRYDNAYVQCMYTYGNLVPGYRRVVASVQPVAIAPPPPPVMSPEPEDYPPPPEVYFDAAPQFIYSPALNMYVAVGVPYDLVYTGSEYFYFYAGRWYRGPYYNGPWIFVPRRSYPPAFLRFRISNIRRFRDAEFRRFELDREHYDGRFHRPDLRRRTEHR